jgi:hypothetical protein
VTVPLSQLIADWLPAAGWGVLEVKGGSIRLRDDAQVVYMGGNPYVGIKDDSVAGISAADPEFFSKLDQYLVRKYFNQAEWYRHKVNPPKPRHQIWP